MSAGAVCTTNWHVSCPESFEARGKKSFMAMTYVYPDARVITHTPDLVAPLRKEPASVSVLKDGYYVHPSREELIERLLRNFSGWRIPKAEREESLDVQVLIHPEQARRGAVVPVGIPFYQCCPQCGGSGREFLLACNACDGRGLVEEVGAMAIVLPPRSTPEMVFESSLQDLGIHNLFLRAHISICR